MAKFVRARIKQHVAEFSRGIRPPTPPPEKLRLPEWDRLFGSFWKGSGRGSQSAPSTGPRPFTIQPGERLVETPDGRLELSGSAKIGFSEHHDPATDSREEVEVVIRCGFVAEDRRSDWVKVAVGAPAGFSDFPEFTEVTRERIAWLFDNDEHDLALAERPECHQDGTSYGAVYGRMHGDRPAPTITTGFMTPGRGRFVHPTERRTLTAAEAARLQGFPDSYFFRTSPDTPPTRAQLAKWVGDAVAAPLGYAVALSALMPALAATDNAS